ncbi:hypothetical protein pEaSNUABM40_00208 [Erwinia phage pEa_SNUABM_40]|nr:hypothetical protein pEaSNUABM40_00208 [Erwinia phage pEa_SNUABM_40]UAW52986.1 hypothetical protein pEaSNUABM23_00204 [Erwinia phage pEa_SNUABM_23]UIW10882.1 hypothetical protein pEaSNUABM23_00204 [Erwinia phage pEa_SNUABM_31]
MEQTINIRTNGCWNVMRHDTDINPVTGKEEKTPQCIFSSPTPVPEAKLEELRKVYRATDLWVERQKVFH